MTMANTLITCSDHDLAAALLGLKHSDVCESDIDKSFEDDSRATSTDSDSICASKKRRRVDDDNVPRAMSFSYDSCDSEELQRKLTNRGRYKCSLCGEIKTNHICKVLRSMISSSSVAIQATPSQCSQNDYFEGHTLHIRSSSAKNKSAKDSASYTAVLNEYSYSKDHHKGFIKSENTNGYHKNSNCTPLTLLYSTNQNVVNSSLASKSTLSTYFHTQVNASSCY